MILFVFIALFCTFFRGAVPVLARRTVLVSVVGATVSALVTAVIAVLFAVFGLFACRCYVSFSTLFRRSLCIIAGFLAFLFLLFIFVKSCYAVLPYDVAKLFDCCFVGFAFKFEVVGFNTVFV